MTSLYPTLNPDAIFERGFITREEAVVLEAGDSASKINLFGDNGEVEGIWVAFLTEEDQKKYGDDASKGEEIRAVLMNNAIAFFPMHSWGRVIVGRTNGDTRPCFRAEDQVEGFEKTLEAYLAEYPLEGL